MYRLTGFLLILLVLYYVAKFRSGGKDPIFTPESALTESLEGHRAKEYLEIKGSSEKMEGTGFEKSVSKILVNIMKTEKGRLMLEKMFRPMNSPIQDKDYTMNVNDRMILDNILNIKVSKESGGRRAICGHRVKVKYSIANMSDMIMDKGERQMHLGSGEIFQGLDNVIVGMKEGEVRTALIPDKFAYESRDYEGKKPLNATKDYRMEVTLNKIESPEDFGDDLYIFDDKVSLKFPMMCGDVANFDARIEELGGKILFDTFGTHHNISYRLGDKNYPLVFSHILFNKDSKGTRHAFLPGKYLQGFTHNVFVDMDQSSIMPEKYYLVKFSNISY